MPVETIKDDEGRIVSYIEWTLCNKEGVSKEDGTYCYVKDLWTHDGFKFKNIIRHYINLIYNKKPTIKYAYWNRKKYADRIKMFSKEQLLHKEK